jgi:hypothetical protein
MKGISTLLVFFFTATMLFAQENWILEKEKNDIKVFNRKLEGSKLKEYKGMVTVKATMDQILKIFKDVSRHEKFIYKAKPGSPKVVKKISENDFYTYMVIDVPWPASTRDVVTHYVVNKPDDKGVVTIDVEAAPKLVPEVSGMVRVPSMKGYWKFIPLKDGKIQIVHQAHSSPGGSVPEGMANTASVETPFSMLTKLKDLLSN